MSAIPRFLAACIVFAALAACGGGKGSSQQVGLPDPPAAPVVTVDADIKQLIFSWDGVPGATSYLLMENPDGHSGFTQVGEDLPAGTTSVTMHIAVHMHDWVNAMYVIGACNAGGCTSSSEVSVADLMLETIGYLKASNTGTRDYLGGDRFGASLAMSSDGNTLAVAAIGEDSGSTGINGNQNDFSVEDSGAVYVFRFDGTHWSQQAYIKASNTGEKDYFGGSLALSADGNTLAVGASGEDSGATSINGDQADDSVWGAGAVYLFRVNGSEWEQQAYIKASNTDRADGFGGSLAMSSDGNTLAVAAIGEDSGSTGINGDQSDNTADTSGAVYLFRFDGMSWGQQAYIKASNTGGGVPSIGEAGDYFGFSVSLNADGNTLAVSAILEDSGSKGINGTQNDFSAEDSGAVYLFQFDGTEWSQQAYIKASNTDKSDWFGESVVLSADGNTLVVGAGGEDSVATGINGNQADNSASHAGAVYLFRFDDTSWAQQAYMKASNTERGDTFGRRIALSADGNTLVVGAWGEDSRATGINGDQAGDSDGGVGAVYLFLFDGTDWYQQAYVKASNTDVGDYFGRWVALSGSGNTLAVGAAEEDSGATGINGDQADDSVEEAGAVYIY